MLCDLYIKFSYGWLFYFGSDLIKSIDKRFCLNLYNSYFIIIGGKFVC